MLAPSSYLRRLLLPEPHRPPATTPPSAAHEHAGLLCRSALPTDDCLVRPLHLLRRKLGASSVRCFQICWSASKAASPSLRSPEQQAEPVRPHLVVAGLRPHHRCRHSPIAGPPIGQIGRSSVGAGFRPPRPLLSSAGSGSRRSVQHRRIPPAVLSIAGREEPDALFNVGQDPAAAPRGPHLQAGLPPPSCSREQRLHRPAAQQPAPLAGSVGHCLAAGIYFRPSHTAPRAAPRHHRLRGSGFCLPSVASSQLGTPPPHCRTHLPDLLLTTTFHKKTMEGADGKQDSETTFIIKVHREPAIIINGVPDLPADSTAGSQSLVKIDTEPQVDPRFGEWLEGRKVRKLFGDTHYVGKVAKYDNESNWYNIIYDDGDQEDLEWRELEKVLLPLDITVPLKTLVMDKCKLKGSESDFGKAKVGRPRKMYATVASMKKTSHTVTISQGSYASNQMAIVRVEGQGQQSNNIQVSNQPRKRGRPRKERPLSSDIQPKKRGRPPKNRNAGNSQSAENTPGSLPLVPVQDDAQESCRKQNSTLIRSTMTARAEKLKRENLRAQSTRSGTQLF